MLFNAAKKLWNKMFQATGIEGRRLTSEERTNEVIYSASDEQIIIRRFIEQIPSVKKFCVDIGAGDGISDSNTYALFRAGWRGLAVECDEEKFSSLAVRHKAFLDVKLSNRQVAPDDVESLMRSHGVPVEFTFLSLDIDGYDYFVLERILNSFQPLLICTEINEKIPPPIRFTVKWDPTYRWARDHFYGQSISQLSTLCARYDYALVGLELNNAFLILRDVCPVPAVTPEEAYREGYLERPDRKEKVPWNADMEALLSMPPDQGLQFLEDAFAKYEGKYICEL